MAIMFAFNTSYAQGSQENVKAKQAEQHKKLSAEEKANKRTDKLVTDLGLDSKQEASVREANLAHFREMEQIRSEMKTLKEKSKAERDANRAAINSVLTAEQKTLLAEKEEMHKKKMADKKGGHKK